MTEKEMEYRMEALREFRLLPLFYLIPKEFAERRNLAAFPREPMKFVTDPYWRKAYHEKHFVINLMDTWALMIWEAFGINGGFVNYSSNHPMVRVAADLALWVKTAEELGIDTDTLALMEQMPFLTLEQAAYNCAVLKQYLWSKPEYKFQQVQEIVNSYRDHRDYGAGNSRAKSDFYRSYYHTRSKYVKMVDLDVAVAEDEGVYENGKGKGRYRLPDKDFVYLEQRLWLDSFAESLNERDRKILNLLYQEYTQEEIAVKLGYANHSGVNKRINHIRKKLREYMEETEKA